MNFFSLCVLLGVTVPLLSEPRWEKRNPGELPSACSEQVNQSGPECGVGYEHWTGPNHSGKSNPNRCT